MPKYHNAVFHFWAFTYYCLVIAECWLRIGLCFAQLENFFFGSSGTLMICLCLCSYCLNVLAYFSVICNINVNHNGIWVKVKFSYTRYRALGPELIPVYRHSARRWLLAKRYNFISMSSYCHNNSVVSLSVCLSVCLSVVCRDASVLWQNGWR